MSDIDEIVARAIQEAMPNAHPQQDPHQKPLVSGEIDDVLIDGTVDLRIVASIVRAALLDAGYTIVPVVPTEKMEQAGDNCSYDTWAGVHAASVWSAMLAAALKETT